MRLKSSSVGDAVQAEKTYFSYRGVLSQEGSLPEALVDSVGQFVSDMDENQSINILDVILMINLIFES